MGNGWIRVELKKTDQALRLRLQLEGQMESRVVKRSTTAMNRDKKIASKPTLTEASVAPVEAMSMFTQSPQGIFSGSFTVSDI